jgi:hypothetical protein
LYTHAHIDTILCWVASSAGIVQEILPDHCLLYHQLHHRLSHAAFPQTDWRPWYDRYVEAIRGGNAMAVNDRDWGLANETFRAWDARPGLVQVECLPSPVGAP